MKYQTVACKTAIICKYMCAAIRNRAGRLHHYYTAWDFRPTRPCLSRGSNRIDFDCRPRKSPGGTIRSLLAASFALLRLGMRCANGAFRFKLGTLKLRLDLISNFATFSVRRWCMRCVSSMGELRFGQRTCLGLSFSRQ